MAQKGTDQPFRIARASAFECAAIMDVSAELGLLSFEDRESYKGALEELSKMLYALADGAKDLNQ